MGYLENIDRVLFSLCSPIFTPIFHVPISRNTCLLPHEQL